MIYVDGEIGTEYSPSAREPPFVERRRILLLSQEAVKCKS